MAPVPGPGGLRENRVAAQPTRTGAVQDGQWFVTEGLKAGDRVVVEGFQKFAPRDNAKPRAFAETDTPADIAS